MNKSLYREYCARQGLYVHRTRLCLQSAQLVADKVYMFIGLAFACSRHNSWRNLGESNTTMGLSLVSLTKYMRTRFVGTEEYEATESDSTSAKYNPREDFRGAALQVHVANGRQSAGS